MSLRENNEIRSEFLNEENHDKLKHFQTLHNRLFKYLNVLTLLLNSRTIMAECGEYEDFASNLMQLLLGKSTYL